MSKGSRDSVLANWSRCKCLRARFVDPTSPRKCLFTQKFFETPKSDEARELRRNFGRGEPSDSKDIDLSRQTVVKIETGKGWVDRGSLRAYLAALGEVDRNGSVTDETLESYILPEPEHEAAWEVWDFLSMLHELTPEIRNEFASWTRALIHTAKWCREVAQKSESAVQAKRGEITSRLMEFALKSIGADLKGLGSRKLTFRSGNLLEDEFHRCWETILKLAEKSDDPTLRLVSTNDIRFWQLAMRDLPAGKSDENAHVGPEARHVLPLHKYPHGKERVMLVDNGALTPAALGELIPVIKWMEESKFKVYVTVRQTLHREVARRLDEEDFGIMGSACFGFFESRSIGADRSLVELFDPEIIAEKRRLWDKLVEAAVYDGQQNLDDLLHHQS